MKDEKLIIKTLSKKTKNSHLQEHFILAISIILFVFFLCNQFLNYEYKLYKKYNQFNLIKIDKRTGIATQSNFIFKKKIIADKK